MFSRIMAVVLAVILVLTIGFSAIGAVVMRQEQTQTRLNGLTAQAREIAWLAGQNRSGGSVFIFGNTSSLTLDYLNRKASQVYQQYGGALVVVVDRMGRVLHNLSTAMQNNPDFVTSLDGQELGDELSKVLAGEEIVLRALTNGSMTFTVGVPFKQNGRVLGAVLIRTPAQTLEGSFWDFLPRIGWMSLAALVLAGVVLFFYIRRVLRPLQRLTRAAEAMAEGDFSMQLPKEGAAPEIRALSASFSSMSDKLSATETQRREFVANVSHELKSPVTSIAGFIQGIEDGTIPAEEQPKYLSLAGDECRRLSKLIGDLLALSRLDREDARPERSHFDLNEMFRRAVIRRMNDLEAKQLEIICDFREDPCMVSADHDRMDQVVINLLDNAIKFTAQQGHITLRTEKSGGKVTGTVADDGVGIREEDQPRVFERFFTEDRAHTASKGTGLGLAICQRILQMHGERIWVSSPGEGQGAAFSFTLQAAQEGVQAS